MLTLAAKASGAHPPDASTTSHNAHFPLQWKDMRPSIDCPKTLFPNISIRI